MSNAPQPKVLLDAMDKIMGENHQYSDQQRVRLLLETWQQRAEIEGLKKQVNDLKNEVTALKMEQSDG